MSNKKDEVDSWARHPTTQWILHAVAKRFDAKGWRNAVTLEDLYRFKGQMDVVDFIRDVLDEPDNYE